MGISAPIFTEFSGGPSSPSFPQNDDIDKLCRTNAEAFNLALKAAQPGDTVSVPDGSSFHLTGGILGRDLNHVTLDIAGSLHFVHSQQVWPFRNSTHHFGYRPAIHIHESSNVTLTCSSLNRPSVYVVDNEVEMDQSEGSGGIVNGYGKIWWDEAILGRLPNKDGDTRPLLIHVESSADVLVEKLTLVNSPFWTLTVEAVGAEVRYVNVLVDRKYQAQLLGQGVSTRDKLVCTQSRGHF